MANAFSFVAALEADVEAIMSELPDHTGATVKRALTQIEQAAATCSQNLALLGGVERERQIKVRADRERRAEQERVQAERAASERAKKAESYRALRTALKGSKK